MLRTLMTAGAAGLAGAVLILWGGLMALIDATGWAVL